jgi:biopolymer transport protein ExbD
LATWDVFHGDRLEMERGLSAGAVREAFLRGELRDDDLIRPAGTKVAWARLAEFPELTKAVEPPAEQVPPAPSFAGPAVAATATAAPPSSATIRKQAPAAEPYQPPQASDFEVESEDFGADLPLTLPETLRGSELPAGSDSCDDVAFPVINDQPPKLVPTADQGKFYDAAPPGGWLWAEEDDDEEENDEDFERGSSNGAGESSSGLEILDDDEELGISTSRPEEDEDFSRSSRIALPVVESSGWDDLPIKEDDEEEVDMSFSRGGPETVEELDLAPMVDVAFQLVLFFMVTATTVLYKTLEIPKPSKEQAPTAVTQGRSLSDLQDDFILVEIDANGGMKMDREPIPANMNTLVERLRTAREKTNRKSMLLSADYATKHRDTVLAIDAAHEIGMSIVIARPAAPVGPAPTLLSQPKAAQPAAPVADGPPP